MQRGIAYRIGRAGTGKTVLAANIAAALRDQDGVDDVWRAGPSIGFYSKNIAEKISGNEV